MPPRREHRAEKPTRESRKNQRIPKTRIVTAAGIPMVKRHIEPTCQGTLKTPQSLIRTLRDRIHVYSRMQRIQVALTPLRNSTPRENQSSALISQDGRAIRCLTDIVTIPKRRASSAKSSPCRMIRAVNKYVALLLWQGYHVWID